MKTCDHKFIDSKTCVKCGLDGSALDLAHLLRIQAILDGIPGDTDLPHALVALEDAFVLCALALTCGTTLDFAREEHRRTITREETRRILAERKKGEGKIGLSS